MGKKALSQRDRDALLATLKDRFDKNTGRHKGIDWKAVQARLEKKTETLSILHEMERTGGEPDVISFDKKTDTYVFVDCSAETPAGRRSLCYDREAEESRKGGVHPEGNVIDVASSLGIELLDEKEYRALQELGEFDLKTSSWLKTPADIRKAGGALFGDRRYGHVFVYHNGAQSFYAARGFRGSLRV